MVSHHTTVGLSSTAWRCVILTPSICLCLSKRRELPDAWHSLDDRTVTVTNNFICPHYNLSPAVKMWFLAAPGNKDNRLVLSVATCHLLSGFASLFTRFTFQCGVLITFSSVCLSVCLSVWYCRSSNLWRPHCLTVSLRRHLYTPSSLYWITLKQPRIWQVI